MVRFALALVLALVAGSAQAGPFGIFGRRPNAAPSRGCTTCSQPVAVQGSQVVVGSDGSDQARCQQEANTMAARRIRGHVGSTIGRFEGVGYGGSPACNTCTPEQYGYRGLRLTGDASARGSDGMWYRVRSWR